MTKMIPLSKNGKKYAGKYFAIVDDCDYSVVNQHNWWAEISERKHAIYARAIVNGHKIYMHRLLMNAPKNLLVDHIDRDGLNCVRQNMRLATKSQNNGNSIGNSSIRTTPFKGIQKFGSRWQSKIWPNGKCINLGMFSTPEAAARAYDAAALKNFGEFASLNFPQQGTPA
jgi:hypothetical protein